MRRLKIDLINITTPPASEYNHALHLPVRAPQVPVVVEDGGVDLGRDVREAVAPHRQAPAGAGDAANLGEERVVLEPVERLRQRHGVIQVPPPSAQSLR
jgi:hypothetical protein